MDSENNELELVQDNESNDIGKDAIYQATGATSDSSVMRQAFRYRTFRCPRCRTDISVTKSDVGKTLECPDCYSKIVVPDYLDFDTESDYERQYFNEDKILRDQKYSPLRNPNRDGIQIGDDVYSVKERTGNEDEKESGELFYPIRCAICETLMQAPAEMLGQTIVCPDCGTKTIVTDYLKQHQCSTDIQLQPREVGIYDFKEPIDVLSSETSVRPAFDVLPAKVEGGETKKPRIVRMKDGKTFVLDPIQKKLVPFTSEETSSLEPATPKQTTAGTDNSVLKKAIVPAIKDKIAIEEKGGEKKKVDPQIAPARLDKTTRERVEKIIRERGEEKKGVVGFWRRWQSKRKARKEMEENVENFLPKMVLRPKNGEMVWTFPSPPKRNPLFNKTFQAVASTEIWARGGLITLTLLGIAYLIKDWILVGLHATHPIVKVFGLAGWACATPLFLVAFALVSVYFKSIFEAGNCGAKRVLDWASEDHPLTYLLTGLRFVVLVAVSAFPGTLLVFSLDISETLLNSALFFSSFWLLFPVFWISTAQSDYPFCPLSSAVFASFIRKFDIWVQFYFTVAFFFFLPSVFWGALYREMTFWYIAPFILLLIPIFFGLLLGRLSWIVDDMTRSDDFDS